MFNDESNNNMSVDDLEKKIDDKIKDLMGAEYEEKPREYHWDNSNLIAYKDKLVERMKKDNPHWAEGAYEEIAERDLKLINPILEKNLVEYINGEPLSNIEVGTEKFSVITILSLRRNIGGVIEALKDLSVYSVDEEEGRRRIIHRFPQR